MELPEGVKLIPLCSHADHRGAFTELFRQSWTQVRPIQWNVVSSRKGVIRGVHVHVRHDDYLTLPVGKAAVGIRDLREGSPTEGRAAVIRLDADAPSVVVIPHGVAHGFLFLEDSLHIYAVTHYWDLADELGCRWDDPGLGISWPDKPLDLSERDANAPSLAKLLETLRPHQPIR
jgi:dTDP-4-dehydrorhamnose 3,5-epimerase